MVGSRKTNIITPQHEQQLDNEEPNNTLDTPSHQRRSLQHWWHGKQNDEKDIVYVNLGVPSNVNTNQLQALHDKHDETCAAHEHCAGNGDDDGNCTGDNAGMMPRMAGATPATLTDDDNNR